MGTELRGTFGHSSVCGYRGGLKEGSGAFWELLHHTLGQGSRAKAKQLRLAWHEGTSVLFGLVFWHLLEAKPHQAQIDGVGGNAHNAEII